MFKTLGEGWQGFGPKWPAGLTPKVANIIPENPIALEGMPPIDGLLIGIVCLSPTLAGSLRDTPVSCSFSEPHPDPQSCLYNLLEGKPENIWPLGGEILYNIQSF